MSSCVLEEGIKLSIDSNSDDNKSDAARQNPESALTLLYL